MFFFFNDTATTEIYTLSLHDALPIFFLAGLAVSIAFRMGLFNIGVEGQYRLATILAAAVGAAVDRKSTRLNSSHANISYAVFCLKKKKHKLIPISKPYIYYY